MVTFKTLLFNGLVIILMNQPVFSEELSPSSVENTQVKVSESWVRAMPPGMEMTAVFFKIKNLSEKNLTISSVSCSWASDCSVHRSVIENGLNKMIAVPELEIPAHQELDFAPGGLHIMAMGLKTGLKIDARLPVSIQFSDSTTLNFQAIVSKK